MDKILVEELNELLHGDPYTVHPAAELFPLVAGEEFESLVNSIREHGIQTPVMFSWDQNEKPVLLDGRNRLRAADREKRRLAPASGVVYSRSRCHTLGLAPWTGDEA